MGDRFNDDVHEFTEGDDGKEAAQDWARTYDELDGAPEGDWDR